MTLELALKIAIAAMGSLSAILLGMGERAPLLPSIAVIMAGCSIYFHEIKGWVTLSERGANLACILAVAVALWDSWQLEEGSQLLAAAHLLVYLQFILLFQKKSNRRYWLLAVLSLMQVAVAAALGLELTFGLLLFTYLLISLGALGLFFAYREVSRYAGVQSVAGAYRALPPVTSALWAVLRPRSQSAIASKDSRAAGTITSTIVGEDETVSWRFARLVLGMTTGTLVVAFLLFFLVPRLEQNPWRRPGVTGGSVVGIPESVSLSEVGTIYESPEAVMRVRFVNQDGEDYLLSEPPLLRGFHLSNYADNRWRQASEVDVEPMSVDEDYTAPGIIWQELSVGPSDSEVLFHVDPAINTRHANRLRWDPRRERILRPQGRQGQQDKFVLATQALQNGRQSRFSPVSRRLVRLNWLGAYQEVAPTLTRLPEIARDAVAGIDETNKLAQIVALNKYLTDPAQFSYTLRPPRRDESMDAIEDFLINNRKGHCEYFASAMALMLRSLQIPSRMVIGYKADEFNALGSFYQIRQLNAHAWVEAYLTFDQLPATLRADPGRWRHGAWYTVDPSPIVNADEALAATTLHFLGLRQLTDYAQFLWSNYIMGMDAQRQQQSIYSVPAAAIKQVTDRRFWLDVGGRLGRFFRGGEEGTVDNSWINLRVILSTVAVLSVLAGLTRVAARRNWFGALRWRPFSVVPPAPLRAETVLFQRLELLLARYHFHRPEGQTPREFAVAAGGLLARSPATRPVAELPNRVVNSFYRLRFAGRGLDRPELETLEHSLAQLEAAIVAADSQEGAARE